MTKRGKPRKFPYYIVVEFDETDKLMRIIDLNSIQWEEVREENGRRTKVFHYQTDVDKHYEKWISVPGAKPADKKRVVDWINEMVFEGTLGEDRYMVYDHRRHFTDPFHEEYKVDSFREWERVQESEDESEDDEEIVLDEEETEDEE